MCHAMVRGIAVMTTAGKETGWPRKQDFGWWEISLICGAGASSCMSNRTSRAWYIHIIPIMSHGTGHKSVLFSLIKSSKEKVKCRAFDGGRLWQDEFAPAGCSGEKWNFLLMGPVQAVIQLTWSAGSLTVCLTAQARSFVLVQAICLFYLVGWEFKLGSYHNMLLF